MDRSGSQLCIRLVTLFSPLLNCFSNSRLWKLHDLGAKPFLSLTYIKASLVFTLITCKHEKAQWFWISLSLAENLFYLCYLLPCLTTQDRTQSSKIDTPKLTLPFLLQPPPFFSFFEKSAIIKAWTSTLALLHVGRWSSIPKPLGQWVP